MFDVTQQNEFHNQLKSFSALTKDTPLSLLLVFIKIPSSVLTPKRHMLIPIHRDKVRHCDEKYKQITTYYITEDSSSDHIAADEKDKIVL